jgi:hypothetical protein
MTQSVCAMIRCNSVICSAMRERYPGGARRGR